MANLVLQKKSPWAGVVKISVFGKMMGNDGKSCLMRNDGKSCLMGNDGKSCLSVQDPGIMLLLYMMANLACQKKQPLG